MKTKRRTMVSPKRRAAVNEFLRRIYTQYPEQILAARLFGSVARGDFDSDSDVDVLVIIAERDWRLEDELLGVAARVSLEYNVVLDPRIYSRALWEQLRAKGRALYRNIEREGIALKLPPRRRATPALAVQSP